jgi:hypothetical protein
MYCYRTNVVDKGLAQDNVYGGGRDAMTYHFNLGHLQHLISIYVSSSAEQRCFPAKSKSVARPTQYLEIEAPESFYLRQRTKSPTQPQ